MYKETLQTRKRGFLYIISVITAAFCLLPFPVWINWTHYSWIYEIFILASAAFFVSFLIRRRMREYTYIINNDKLSVKIKIGNTQKTVCETNITEIKAVIIGLTKKEFKNKFNADTFYRCNGDIFGTDGMSIVFSVSDKEKASVMVLKPSEKFTEILQLKRIDK